MGNRSNSVFGPARRPIFDPSPKRGNAKRYVPRSPAQAVSDQAWSFSGDITPAGLIAAGVSPRWAPRLPGIHVDAVFARLGARVANCFAALNTSTSLYVPVPIENATDDADGWVRVDVNVDTDAAEFWVDAAGAGTGTNVIGHGLTVIMWYWPL
jgi:hypothetical protein